MIKNRYFDLIDQTFYFPQEGFDIEEENLIFNGVPLRYLIDKYGTPLKLTYLPKIGTQIKKAKNLFNKARKAVGYKGKYYYCYCTKSSHFSYVLKEVLRHGVELETSSSFDIDLVRKLHKNGWIDKKVMILNNGFKTLEYATKICDLINDGFNGVIPILDNKQELEYYQDQVKGKCTIGIRVATEEEPNFEFYTSRLGIRGRDVVDFYNEKLKGNDKFILEMLHFFVDTGIKDSIYYWGELKKAVKLYCQLKKVCPALTALNIGGGMPIRNSLGSEFDYNYMVQEIVTLILNACQEEGIPEPDIFTEFGRYTVGESGAIIFSVLDQKQQNDAEVWYMIDNSLINTIPDSWSIGERFILLPVNKWQNEYRRVNIGGLSCDNSDYYNSEIHESQVYLPIIGKNDKEPLYLGFFHTGAYQDALSGYGGIKHCLIPAPKRVLIYKDSKGNIVDMLYREEQKPEEMLSILGYD
jgi:arginine decarboxylase